MSASLMFWLVLTMVAIFLEMLTRTFTLMTLALGFGTAALLAWLGFGIVGQVIGFLLVGGSAMLWLRRSDKGQELQEA